MTEPAMRLDLFKNSKFERGASRLTEAAWIALQAVLFASWLPGSGWRVRLLRAFGASVGAGVVIKPHVSIKFPWRLEIGDHVWIGERVWIDNLDQVSIGSHSCISQGAYLCTGSHDWTDNGFALITRPINIGQGCWVGAHASIAPGSALEDGCVLAMTAFGVGRLEGDHIHLRDGSTRLRNVAGGPTT